MINAISAYRAMIDASANDASAKKEKTSVKAVGPAIPLSEVVANAIGSSAPDGDLVSISGSRDVYTAVDSFYNMGKSNRFEDFHNLSREDKETFVNIVAELAKSGYMGYEELIVDNKVERHDIAHQIGDDRIRGARVYDESKDRIR